MQEKKHIDFVAQRHLAAGVSVILIICSLMSLGFRGLNLGLDFTGGTLVEVHVPAEASLEDLRAGLSQTGFTEASVQHFGSLEDILVRVATQDSLSNQKVGEAVFSSIKNLVPNSELRRIEFVGPKVGEELSEQGGLAMLVALLGILIYVAMRFEYRFAIGAVLALVHDVTIVLGIFSLAGIEFDLTVLAALLAVIGYSLNDTIVVYDRIRENFLRIRKGSSMQIVNVSLNQTLSRTLVTSLTTLLVLVALYYFGGALIHGFSMALILGVLVGTYSSIYVASSILLAMGINKMDLMPPVKEGEGTSEEP